MIAILFLLFSSQYSWVINGYSCNGKFKDSYGLVSFNSVDNAGMNVTIYQGTSDVLNLTYIAEKKLKDSVDRFGDSVERVIAEEHNTGLKTAIYNYKYTELVAISNDRLGVCYIYGEKFKPKHLKRNKDDK